MPHRLLLADDSATIQRVIELTFAEEAIDVVSVGDGRAAVARLEAERFDIVLADVDMPGLDGFEVASFVRSRAELSGVPVVLLTGAFDPLDHVRVADCGAAAVLVKPFEPQMAVAKVRELLGGPPAPSIPAAAAAAPRPAASSADEYFARLDKAFATLDPLLEPRAPRPGAAPDTVAPAAGAARPKPPAVAPEAAAAAQPVDAPGAPAADAALADAFATLLAVEQGELPPSALSPARAVDDELVDRVARRVVEQLGDAAVRDLAADIVSRTAERLVREEIERIKAAAADA